MKFAAHHGVLPDDLVRKIPRSTLWHWEQNDPSYHVGIEFADYIEHVDVLKVVLTSKAARMTATAVFRLSHLIKSLGVTIDRVSKIQAPQIRKRVIDTINRLKDRLPLDWMLKQLGLSRSRFSSWSKNVLACLGSPLSLCRRRHPNQLTVPEVTAIKRGFSNPLWFHWPSISVAWKLIHDKLISANVQTVVRYARILGLTGGRKGIKKDRKVGSISASKPNEVWHVDVTFIKTVDGIKKAVQFVIDNFSRKILSFAVSDHPTWKNTVKVLTEAHRFAEADSFEPTVLISDAGSENDNGQVAAVSQELSIKHLIAQRDVVFSNSVIEAWNKIFKGRYIFRKPIPDVDHVESAIVEAVSDYNDRPHYLIKGLTPNQAYRGELFDRRAYRERIVSAGEHRREINRRACSPIGCRVSSLGEKPEVGV